MLVLVKQSSGASAVQDTCAILQNTCVCCFDSKPPETGDRSSMSGNAPQKRCNCQQLAADALVAGTDLATKQQPNPASNGLLDEDMGPLRRAPPSRAGLSRASLQGPEAITDGIVQFAGEREMWASFQDANLRKQKRLKALVAGTAVLVSACIVCTFCGSSF